MTTSGVSRSDHVLGRGRLGSADAFMSSSSLYSNADSISQSTSSVFRNNLGHIPAPPGLGGPPRATSMDGVGAGNRGRAATWVAGSMSGSDMFGSGTLYEYSGDDTLAGDLASILKLSGAEEKSDTGRSGTFNNDITGFL